AVHGKALCADPLSSEREFDSAGVTMREPDPKFAHSVGMHQKEPPAFADGSWKGYRWLTTSDGDSTSHCGGHSPDASSDTAGRRSDATPGRRRSPPGRRQPTTTAANTTSRCSNR